MYEDEYDDSLAVIESMRGCMRCDLYWEWLPGCPHYCAKWKEDNDEIHKPGRSEETF